MPRKAPRNAVRGRDRVRDADDQKLPEDDVELCALVVVDLLGRHDDRLRLHARVTKRVDRADPGLVQGRRDDERRRATAQARKRLDERLADAVRATGLDLGEVLHELAELLRAAIGMEQAGRTSRGPEPDAAVLAEG